MAAKERCVEWAVTHFLCRVPHNMLDILCVRVHHSNTLIVILFIHCQTQTIIIWEAQVSNFHALIKILVVHLM